ncbi:MFS transporter [Lysinibacillus sp. NPDC097279]|uniref:MFS transporter n=1 Tax=unclassified Lysinibacillus TaxID=2636778 RepID=UPI001172662E|nr:MFS transporter [Lysinibacillus sp. CD3-6]QPQ34075.1 MFS transporter [Lysinibacillus sp. JNUCC-52]UED79973.1 MFS transporter [Lysinibacillus sp. CD3-6]
MKKFIYLIIFFSFFDLFTQLPVMSTYAESLGASAFLTGLAVGMYSLSNTFGNIISGFLTDRKGPFIILIIGLLTTGLSLTLYNLVEAPLALLIVRFIHGLVAGFIVPAAFTFLANATEQEKRGKGSAISGAFVGIAAIIGPAFSGILASRTSVPFVFNITASCMLLLGILSFFLLNSNKVKKEKSSSSTYIPISVFFNNAGTLKAFSGAFFLMFSQGVIAYLLPLKVQSLGFDSRLSGTLMSAFGIVAVLVFILPSNRIFDKVAPVKTLSLGIALMGLSQILISQADSSMLLYIAMACYGIGFGLLFPSVNSLLIDSTTVEIRGKAYGYFYAFFSLGVVLGSSLLGWLSLGVVSGFIFTGIVLITFAGVTLIPNKQGLFHKPL